MDLRAYLVAAAAFCVILAPVAASAGPGANVNACVYLPVAPAKPIKFDFKAGSGSDVCMKSSGKDASLTAKSAGVTCVSVGYVESTDACIPSNPKWTLGYSATEGGYSGSTESKWITWAFGNNEIDLEQMSTGTFVCAQPNMCNATKQQWPQATRGPLYIIFSPGAH